MTTLDKFCAVHTPGLFITNQDSVTALSLLFDKVYLPSNIEAVMAFSKAYRIRTNSEHFLQIKIEPSDPFVNLSEEERLTALKYIDYCNEFAFMHSELFGEVFQTNAFEGGNPLKVKLVKQGKPGELNSYDVSRVNMMIPEGDDELFPNLIEKGYVPVVTHRHVTNQSFNKLNQSTTKQLAALLAMKSVEMIIPRFRATKPEVILEARDRLKDHLPQFWSAMFKLTTDFRKLIKDVPEHSNVFVEAENLIDATVRPALLDLRHKIELERKQWFYHILSPIYKGLRLMIGSPPLSQQQLITNSLVLAADTTSSVADHIRTIESLKNQSGLTYLLELDKLTEADEFDDE